MSHKAVLKIECENAHSLFRVLKPEFGDEFGTRITTEVKVEEDRKLLLQVTAKDIPALRATLNMWLRIINVAYEMQELVEYGSNSNESPESTRDAATATAATSDGRRSKNAV